jgi:hypothetical protein
MVLFGELVPGGGQRIKEKGIEDEYGLYTRYLCM